VFLVQPARLLPSSEQQDEERKEDEALAASPEASDVCSLSVVPPGCEGDGTKGVNSVTEYVRDVAFVNAQVLILHCY
jgi:hypothetical protein